MTGTNKKAPGAGTPEAKNSSTNNKNSTTKRQPRDFVAEAAKVAPSWDPMELFSVAEFVSDCAEETPNDYVMLLPSLRFVAFEIHEGRVVELDMVKSWPAVPALELAAMFRRVFGDRFRIAPAGGGNA